MLGFVTTTTHGNVSEILKATDVNPKIFNVITTSDIVDKPKPHPDAYNTALNNWDYYPIKQSQLRIIWTVITRQLRPS